MSEMNETAWIAAYEPMDGPTEGETGNWERDEVLAALAAGTITEQQVWTVVDDGDAECAVSGWAVVNRMHHKVTKHSWPGEPGDVVAVLTRYCMHCGTYMERACGICHRPLSQDAQGTWIDHTGGDVCMDNDGNDVIHAPAWEAMTDEPCEENANGKHEVFS